MNKLRVFEAFAGYGSQSIALRNIGVDYEVVGISEIDKYALQAYYALHDEDIPNLGDISKLKTEDIPDHDLFTYSFPCQDVSSAGKTRGIIRGETRSGLLYECERIIEGKRPKYLLLENVKNLVGKKFKPQFEEWLSYLEGLGYTNYWKVLNAKNYGIPQNRERVFVVSILNDTQGYEFPKPIKLDKCIKDILEDEVDEKYYLSEKIQKRFKMTNENSNILDTTKPDFRKIGQRDLVYNSNGIMGSLVATDYKQPKQIAEINKLGMLDIKGSEQIRRVYGTNGISPTLDTMQGGNRQPKILCEGHTQATKHGYIEYKGDEVELPCIGASRGRNPENPTSRVSGLPTEQQLEINTKGTSNTITTVQKDNYVVCEQRTDEGFFKDDVCGTTNAGGDKRILELHECRIRKLTPRECFRLMGMKDNDIDKIQQTGISNTQQYKMAGNSIVVDVLEAIFINLFKN